VIRGGGGHIPANTLVASAFCSGVICNMCIQVRMLVRVWLGGKVHTRTHIGGKVHTRTSAV
jgi:hypothetical protein